MSPPLRLSLCHRQLLILCVGSIPTRLLHLKKLRVLQLHQNRLSGAVAAVFALPPLLFCFSRRCLSVKVVFPNTFHSSKVWKGWSFSAMNFGVRVIATCFLRMNVLLVRIIVVVNFVLSGPLPKEWVNLTSLQHVDLRSNKFTGSLYTLDNRAYWSLQLWCCSLTNGAL